MRLSFYFGSDGREEGMSVCQSPDFAELVRVAVIEPKKRAEDTETMRCRVCKGTYSASEARVQRGLKQFTGKSRAKKNSETPRLCWVCVRLYYSSREVTE
jgi:hypothetical protein